MIYLFNFIIALPNSIILPSVNHFRADVFVLRPDDFVLRPNDFTPRPNDFTPPGNVFVPPGNDFVPPGNDFASILCIFKAFCLPFNMILF